VAWDKVGRKGGRVCVDGGGGRGEGNPSLAYRGYSINCRQKKNNIVRCPISESGLSPKKTFAQKIFAFAGSFAYRNPILR
jgi:hypothetical protein